MAQKLVAALALAQLSQALLDDHVEVEVVKRVNNVIPPPDILADVMGAQQLQGNPGLTACAVADVVMSSCYDRGVLATTAPVASAEACLCCYSATALYPAYSSCASYIRNAVPTASSVFSVMSVLWEECSSAGRGICTAGGGGAGGGGGGGIITPTVTPTVTPTFAPTAMQTRTSSPSIITAAPRSCTSLTSVISSCSEKLGPALQTIRDPQLASCLCYDGSGSYNTAVEDYASGCAPWAKTAATSLYSLFTSLQTFCDNNPEFATPTSGIVFTPVGPIASETTEPSSPTAPAGSTQPAASAGQGSNAAAASNGGVARGLAVCAAAVFLSVFYLN